MPGEFDWFPMYPRHFLTSRKVKRLNNEEVGIYLKLLLSQWLDGSLPNNMEDLANICGCQESVMTKSWQRLSDCFTEADNGSLYNEFLEEVREEQRDRYEKRSRAGKAGAAAKHELDKRTDLPEQTPSKRGEESIVEEKREEENIYDADFEEAWALFPAREGGNPKKAAHKAWKARLREGIEPEELIGATARYAEFCDNKGIIGSSFVMMASTFYGPNERWREAYEVQEEPEYVPPPYEEPLPEIPPEEREAQLEQIKKIREELE